MINKTIATYAVGVDEVKKQLNIEATFTDDDAYITTLIEVASDYIAGRCAADVEVTTCVLDVTVDNETYTIQNAPFISLTSVVNSDSVDVVGDCTVESTFDDFTITFPDADDYTVTWQSGYNTMPKGIRQSIIIKAADLYDSQRSSYYNSMNVINTNVIDGLLGRYLRQYHA